VNTVQVGDKFENHFEVQDLAAYLETIAGYYEAEKLYYSIEEDTITISEEPVKNCEVYFSDC